MFSDQQWLANSGSGFYNKVATQSLRLDSGSSARLEKTPNASNRKVWTWSAWVKRTKLGVQRAIWSAGSSSGFAIFFNSDDTLRVWTGGGNGAIYTNAVFKDTNSWYHISLTSKNSGNYFELYINGVKETSFSYDNRSNYPAGNDTEVNSNAVHYLGAWNNGGLQYFDGYLADVNFLDGITVSDTSGVLDEFIEIKNGVSIPKKYTGSYGTNGYRLEFKQTGVGTASTSTIGADTSGNTNHYTSSGIVASDCNMPDSPENNFCTLNPLDSDTNHQFSEGNLKLLNVAGGDNYDQYRANFGKSSGKWYWEINMTYYGYLTGIGVATSGKGNNVNPKYWRMLGLGSWLASNNSNVAQYTVNQNVSGGTNWSGAGTATPSANTIYMIALDCDNNKIWWGSGGNWFNTSGTANPATGTDSRLTLPSDEVWFPAGTEGSGGGGRDNGKPFYNFGQDSSFGGTVSAQGKSDSNDSTTDFYYTPPSGYLALTSFNIPESTISPNTDTQASDYFKTYLYTGNSTDNRAITGIGFEPDWCWFKKRSAGMSHYIVDSSRGTSDNNGVGTVGGLNSNATEGEIRTSDGGFKSFDPNGFTLGQAPPQGGYPNAGYERNNAVNSTYVAWNWKAGGATPKKIYRVVVVSDNGNKYRFRNSANSATFGASAVTLDLQEGGTYTFDQSDSTNNNHPFRFSTTSNGTHAGGSAYTTGVTVVGTPGQAGAYTQIVVANSAPQLYYYCTNHSNMGGQANTNTTHGSTNFDGSILTVSQTNTDAGFSIVTGTTSNVQANDMTETFGHGLSGTPDFIILKPRSVSFQWSVWTSAISINDVQGIVLNSTGGLFTNSSYRTIQTTSSVVKIGRQAVENNNTTFVCYAFKEVEGYSKFGSFTGTGVADGTFVNTGFRPAFVLVKRSSTTGNWTLMDNTRKTFNFNNTLLYPNASQGEAPNDGYNGTDFLSNGFKVRGGASGVGTDTSGTGTYIYMAFAEAPFKYANAR